MIHDDILQTMGKTPLVRIKRLNPNRRVELCVKIEYFNPGGSIKDRVAAALIAAAEAEGSITPDKTIIEATSGNTGVGLAMVCAVKGLKLKLLMPETASKERQMIMRAYGAEIVLTPGRLSTDGAIEEAYRLAREEPEKYVLMDQFNNPASIDAHYQGTGLEIFEQTDGLVTHVVCTLGTSGTAMGVTKRLKEMNPAIQIVAVEPNPGHAIQGLKNMQASYPPGIYNKKTLDRIVRVEDEEAFETARKLAREEGMLVGMSSGAAMAAGVRLVRELESGLVVVILPDGGERYLSTDLFAKRELTGLFVHDLAKDKPASLESLPEQALLHTTGPALDDPDDPSFHRRLVWLDLLSRRLKSLGRTPRLAVGLADYDDRALDAASTAGVSRSAYADARSADLARTAELLGVSGFNRVRASTRLEQALEYVRALVQRGAAYEKMRSVYFDVLKLPHYGKLSKMDVSGLHLGRTVDLEDYVKANPQDFTLLKRAGLKELKTGDYSPTEWGNVRPSWFLQEAAAVDPGQSSFAVFAVDSRLVFPHVENLRAIWELGAGFGPLAFWPVGPVEGLDSTEFAAFVRETPVAARLFLLGTTHRKPVAAGSDLVRMWRKNQARVQRCFEQLTVAAVGEADLCETVGADVRGSGLSAQLTAGLHSSLDRDASLSDFWPTLFTFCREMDRAADRCELSPAAAAEALSALNAVDALLGVVDRRAAGVPVPAEVTRLAAERDAARTSKNFAKADALRAEIEALGWRLNDGPNGSTPIPR